MLSGVNTDGSPITVALIDDYDVVLAGVAGMLAPYRDQVQILEIDTNKPLATPVDVALYDSFAQTDTDQDIPALVQNPLARRVAVYTWNFHPRMIDKVRQQGADGYLSKTLPARDLVRALQAIHSGEVVISDPPPRGRTGQARDWPGRHEGLSDREAEILALITQGKNNEDIAAATFLSPNTIKSYIRATYRKIGVTSRTQAVLWGVEHGFRPDHHRIDLWRPAASSL
jgi:DNA-binding NarL/FixJ family response regulator